jgi:hypothetical protein
VLAFVRRRSFSLSCVIVLLGCSIFTFLTPRYGHNGEQPQAGLIHGNFIYSASINWETEQAIALTPIHKPMFGVLRPKIRRELDGMGKPSSLMVFIPIWLPLSAVLGWIVIRELRWREKQEKPDQP